MSKNFLDKWFKELYRKNINNNLLEVIKYFYLLNNYPKNRNKKNTAIRLFKTCEKDVILKHRIKKIEFFNVIIKY